MPKKLISNTLILILAIVILSSCSQKQEPIIKQETKIVSKDLVHRHLLKEVRLGDGVPLSLDLSIRWKIEDQVFFQTQFSTADSFNFTILEPRALELTRNVSNTFPSVDSVFSAHRQAYLQSVKEVLLDNLGESGITVKEIIISKIDFPKTYTSAMEQVGLQRQELERIRQVNILELEKAEANKRKAAADGQVAIAKAESDGKLQKIKAKTEESRRASELAKAETQSQVARMKAKDDAERKKLLAKADLEQKTDLKNMEIQRQRDLEQIQIDKQSQLDRLAFQNQLELAKLCTENPVYASFLVNKELASKVEIAVLPTGTDATVFGNILNNTMQNN